METTSFSLVTEAEARTFSRARWMVVDDDRDGRWLLQCLLETMTDAEIETYPSGEAAWRAFRAASGGI